MDDALLARWRRGDFEAFLELARPHLPSLRALAALLAPPSASSWDADDLTQDALIEAYRSAGSYDERRGEFPPWLAGVVRVRARRAWQTAERDRRALCGLLPRPAEEVEADPQLDALRSCVDGLPEHSRGLIRAHYAEGLAAERLAARLGKSASAVYVTLHRIRRALRDCVSRKLGVARP